MTILALRDGESLVDAFERVTRERDEARAERDRLRKVLWLIDQTLRVPAAEYVPAIRDVFVLIDAALKETP